MDERLPILVRRERAASRRQRLRAGLVGLAALVAFGGAPAAGAFAADVTEQPAAAHVAPAQPAAPAAAAPVEPAAAAPAQPAAPAATAPVEPAAPAAAAPVEPAAPAVAAPAEPAAPAAAAPAEPAAADDEPAPADPGTVDPAASDPAPSDPATEDPGAESPADPGAEEPRDPATEDPGTEPPDNPGADDPATETPTGPGAEEPGEPAPQDPATEEPAGEQPTEPAPTEPEVVEPAPTEPVVEAPPVEATPEPEAPVEDQPATRPTPIDTTTAPPLPKPATGSGVLRPTAPDAPAQEPDSADTHVANAPANVTSQAQLQSAPPRTTPTAALDPVVSVPISPGSAAADAELERAQRAAEHEAAVKRIVHKTLVNLGIVPADPVTAQIKSTPSSAPDGPVCAPVVVSSAAPSPAAGTVPAPVAQQVQRKQRLADEPNTVRGPPVTPLEGPSSPLTASAAAPASTSAASGLSFFAVLVGSVSAQLAEAEAAAPPCSFASNAATPTSDLSARGPPAS
jgi:hypothetical protein